ncbi:MAG: DUF4403 family protein [Proteobacteria bacterium]|nr:DUF4403 family protein [Pseudomonadota bacterium]
MTRWILCLTLLLAACSHDAGDIPRRVDTAPDLPRLVSTIVVPVSARLADLAAEINRATPQTLWTIDKREAACVPAQRITACAIKRKDGSCRIGIKKLKVTPNLSCRIVGQAVRGPIRLSGNGSVLTLTLPVRATVSAQDIGHVIKRETATGAANVRATVRLSLARDWNPTATVRIAYDWTNPPGIDIFGKRIVFVETADARLASVIAGLERSLPKQLAKLHVRDRVSAAWRQGFAVIQLNREHPPVWMRTTPQALGFGGYRVRGGDLLLDIQARTLAETFVGDRPSAPAPTPLPAPASGLGQQGLAFNIPVLAQYDQLEPVVLRALEKRAAKGISLPKLGAVDTEFGKVTIYATEGGRLAVGVWVKAKLRSGLIGETRGEVWLSGLPVNEENSERIRITDLKIATRTNSKTVNMLIALFDDPQTIDAIRTALTEDFAKDYARVLAAARTAIASRREGDVLLSANINKVTHGKIMVTGKGLFLPVQAYGTATIAYRPAR